MEQEDVRGRGSVGAGGGDVSIGSGDRLQADAGSVSMMCWNVAGWSKGDVFSLAKSVDRNDFRAKVLDSYNPDITCLVETWLREDEEVEFDGFKWFGKNRSQLNRKAVRGSGGVGMLVKSSWCQLWSGEIVNVETEDIMWMKFVNKQTMEVLFVAVCYIPPEGSSRDVDAEERFQMLSDQVQKYQSEGRVVVCGDFNARCGGLKDIEDEMNMTMGDRKSVDTVKNYQGELLIECMQSSGLCFVNGRKGNDDFTSVSSKGCSVVDNCLLPTEDLNFIDDFTVTTMSKCEAVLCADEEGLRIPDHSVLKWKVLTGDCVGSSSHCNHDPLSSKSPKTKYVVPEGYMSNETPFIQNIIHDQKLVAGDQVRLDEIYDELCEGLRGSLKVVNCSRKTKNQPWFTANLVELRNTMHKSEAKWLKCSVDEDRVTYRNEYLKVRQSYSKAVKKAKREFRYHKQMHLEAELGC